jgi:hypothetical protein
MRTTASFLASLALAAAPAFNQTERDCETPFTVDFPAGRELALDLQPAEIEILGTDEPEVRVECRTNDPVEARRMRVGFTPSARGGKLRVTGGPRNNLRLRIYVPSQVNLELDCAAGNVRIEDVEGNMDIDLSAGNLDIHGLKPPDYRSVDLSVTAGNVEAEPFGKNKSGLFRSVKQSNGRGKFRLRAHLSAGNIHIH